MILISGKSPPYLIIPGILADRYGGTPFSIVRTEFNGSVLGTACAHQVLNSSVIVQSKCCGRIQNSVSLFDGHCRKTGMVLIVFSAHLIINSKGSGICNGGTIIEIVGSFLRTILYLISVSRIGNDHVNAVSWTIISLSHISNCGSHMLTRYFPVCRGCVTIVALTCNGNSITVLICTGHIPGNLIIFKRIKYRSIIQFYLSHRDRLLWAVILKLWIIKCNRCICDGPGLNDKNHSGDHDQIVIISRKGIIWYLIISGSLTAYSLQGAADNIFSIITHKAWCDICKFGFFISKYLWLSGIRGYGQWDLIDLWSKLCSPQTVMILITRKSPPDIIITSVHTGRNRCAPLFIINTVFEDSVIGFAFR